MSTLTPLNELTQRRVDELVRARHHDLSLRTDRLFIGLMIVQWTIGILLACTLTPLAWEGTVSSMHPHVAASFLLGGALSGLSCFWLVMRPGSTATRHVLAVVQVLWSSLLIHLTGGRIETHFHVFGSLAFLAFYRDVRVLVTATVVVAADHLLRGLFWPYSVYGILTPGLDRTFEHIGWVLFEDFFLIVAIRQSLAEMRDNAVIHALLEQSHERVEEEVRRRTDELKSTEEKLLHAQKMEAVGRLAGGIAHDFNNLLCIISGNSEVLKEEFGPTESAHEIAVEISQAADRASSLTRQLLIFSRQQLACPEVLNLNAIVQRTRTFLGRVIGEDIYLTTTLDPKLRPVRSDAGQLEQVIWNLAVNARDAMPQGGKITIETANVPLDATSIASKPGIPPGDYVLLALTDTGSGMDATVKSQIFEPFFTTKEKGKGTGLGLSTVYGIVKQWNGYVDVYSEVGIGTCFKIYLPAQGGIAPQAASPVNKRQSSSETETILLVEDEEAVRGFARRTLSKRGYRVLEAGNGMQALEVARQFSGEIDLMLTDVVMPHMGGRQLAEAISAERGDIPVLFMSGYTDDAIVRHGILAAETNFLQKPFSGEALTTKVRKILDECGKTEPLELIASC